MREKREAVECGAVLPGIKIRVRRSRLLKKKESMEGGRCDNDNNNSDM